MGAAAKPEVSPADLFEFLLRMGDSTLILGHRVSEWCGHSPVLEEDIALANTALDLIGQTQMWLGLAGEVEGTGRNADALAYLRDAVQRASRLVLGFYRDFDQHSELRVRNVDGTFAPARTYPRSADPKRSKG